MKNEETHRNWKMHRTLYEWNFLRHRSGKWSFRADLQDWCMRWYAGPANRYHHAGDGTLSCSFYLYFSIRRGLDWRPQKNADGACNYKAVVGYKGTTGYGPEKCADLQKALQKGMVAKNPFTQKLRFRKNIYL